MKILTVPFLISLTVLGTPLFSQDQNIATSMPWGANIGLIRNLKLNLSDEVVDDCWTNSDLIRSNTFLSLEQNDIYVPDYEVAFYNFKTAEGLISAVGYRTSNGICAVSAEFKVRNISSQRVGGVDGKEVFRFENVVDVFERGAIFTNSDNTNQQLRDFFEGAVSEFIAQGISSRRNVDFQRYLSLYPNADEPPMSQTEWNNIVSEVTSEMEAMSEVVD